MEILIIGGGLVGATIARDLQGRHNITIVEPDSDRASELEARYDVLVVEGSGTHLKTLQTAGVDDADIILASTDDDETNIVACATAKIVSEAYTVSRVRSTDYYESWQQGHRAFGVDLMVSTNLLTAQEIANLMSMPAAHYVENFSNNRVLMAEFDVDEASTIAGQTVREADQFESVTFAAIIENGSVTIADGTTVIQPGARIVIIGSPVSVRAFANEMLTTESTNQVNKVVVVGASGIGRETARLLCDSGISTIVIDDDPHRTRSLAEELPDVRVIRSDTTDVSFLESENIGEADALVATLPSEADNLLECILGNELGIERTIAITDHPKFIDLFERVGVDVALSPRNLVAAEIIGYTQEWNSEKVALVETDLAEVVEIEIDTESILAGNSIAVALEQLTHDIVIGSIIRDGEFIKPRGETVIEVGDHVVVFVRSEAIEEAIELI